MRFASYRVIHAPIGKMCSAGLLALSLTLTAGCPPGTTPNDNANDNDNGPGQTVPTTPTATFVHSVVDEVGDPSTVLFDASGSLSGDAPLSTYTWDFGDGSDPVVLSGPIAAHTYLAAGTYTVAVTVEDEDGESSGAVFDVLVAQPLPAVPSATLDAAPTVGEAPLTVSFDASASDAGRAPAQIVSYSWDFGDGSPEDNDATTTHEYTDVAAYVVTLTVTNDAGNSDTATVVIDARAPAFPPPTASFSADPDSGEAPLTVSFDATGSEPGTADGEIVEYAWDFGDGSDPAATATATVAHIYQDSGSFLATLTVTDNHGGSDTINTLIRISAGPVLTAITVDPSTVNLGDNETQQLTVTGHFDDASTLDLTDHANTTFASTDEEVATVSDSGLVTATGFGLAEVVVSHADAAVTLAVSVGTSLVVTITRDPPAGQTLRPGDSLTLTAAITDGTIASIDWLLSLDGSDATNLLSNADAAVTTVDTSQHGTYMASFIAFDSIGQFGTASLSFTVVDLTGSLVARAGDASRAIPTSEDFLGDDPFSDGALLISGQQSGLVEGLSGSASDSAQGVAAATYRWTLATAPAPVAVGGSSPPDVLILDDDAPTTDFHIRPVPEQIALLSSGLAGVYDNRVVPGEYFFMLTVNNLGNIDTDTVRRTITPGFDVLGPGAPNQSFEGVALRAGSVTHRVIGPNAHPVAFAALTRQVATLTFDLFDDGSVRDDQGLYTSRFFDETWCDTGANGCVSDQGSFTLTPGTSSTPVAPPSIDPLDVSIEAGSRGTYLIRAHLTDGAFVESPGVDSDPLFTGAVTHVQEDYPAVIFVDAPDPAIGDGLDRLGLVNSATTPTTLVAPVAVHGARTAGASSDWAGNKILSHDINRDGFPEVFVVHNDKVVMFSGLSENSFDVMSTLTDAVAVGATELTLNSGVGVEAGDRLTVDADSTAVEVVTVTTTNLDANTIDVTAMTNAHEKGAMVLGYSNALSPSVSPIDNAKNNDGTLGNDGNTLVQLVIGGPITDVCFCDVNDDRFADLIVGRGSYDAGQQGAEGRVEIYFHHGAVGHNDDPYWNVDVTLTRPNSDTADKDMFGYSLACGDVTGDGIDDLLVGSPRTEASDGGATTGAVFGFAGPIADDPANVVVGDLGENATFRIIPTGSLAGDWVGTAVAVDSNSTTSRIVFGAPGRENDDDDEHAGAVFVVNGGTDLVDDTDPVLVTTTDALFEGDQAGLALGRRIAVGQLTGNADGDIVASAAAASDSADLSAETAQGAIYVIPGGTQSETDIATLPHMSGADPSGGIERNFNLGASLAVGDFNRDGLDDLLVTAPSVSSVNHQVFVVFGAASLPQALPLDITLVHVGGTAYLSTPSAVSGAPNDTAVFYNAGGCAWADANGDRMLDLIFSGTGTGFQAVMIAGRE